MERNTPYGLKSIQSDILLSLPYIFIARKKPTI